jgi:hypothetical protein
MKNGSVRSGITLHMLSILSSFCQIIEVILLRAYAAFWDSLSGNKLFDEALIELDGGQIVRMPELGARLSVGDKGPASIQTTAHGYFWRASGYFAATYIWDGKSIRNFWRSFQQFAYCSVHDTHCSSYFLACNKSECKLLFFCLGLIS